MNYGKARLAKRVLGRAVGGNVFMMMAAGWAGKKIYNHLMNNRKNARRLGVY
ncbi:MAG TPA: hypothetical protein VER03_17315 [Bryobacteraceae bacterium]|nr:hypothetical protein [Bryobacteraceae bacterium]